MEVTENMRRLFTKFETVIDLEEDDKKRIVLGKIMRELKEEIRQAEYIVKLGVDTNQQEIQNQLEQISEETKQQKYFIKIEDNQQLDEELRENLTRHSW